MVRCDAFVTILCRLYIIRGAVESCRVEQACRLAISIIQSIRRYHKY